MYVVIFRARVREFDDAYSRAAAQLRELALSQFELAQLRGGSEIGRAHV